MIELNKCGIVAANVYFSGVCNLQCRYCFQPKIGSIMSEVNKKIIDWISSGRMEDDILEYYGENVKCLSLWGGEPSINLPYLVDRLESIYDRFPNLEDISYSTNISTPQLARNTQSLIEKVAFLNRDRDRKVRVGVQFSIDGIPEINDYNRIGCSAESIMENIDSLLAELEKFKKSNGIDSLRLRFSFKGTHSTDSLKWLCEGDNLERHYKYFDDWYAKWDEKYKYYPRGGEFITFVYPGNFTQEDGQRLCDLTKKLYSKEFQSKFKMIKMFEHQISSRIRDGIRQTKRGYYRDFKGEYVSCSSCSAGRSCLGISYDKKIHLCQSTYFFSEEVMDYIEKNNLVSEFEEKQGFSFRNFGNYAKDFMAVDADNPLEVYRLLTVTNGFVNGLATRSQYYRIVLNELAMANQISDVYKDERQQDLAMSFLISASGPCPANNIFEYGSIWVTNPSVYRLMFNGVFEFVMSHCDEWGNIV